MDSQSNSVGRTGRDALAALFGELSSAAVALLIAIQTLSALVLIERRISGALVSGSAPWMTLAWMLMAALMAIAARAAWFSVPRTHLPSFGDAVVLYVPLAVQLTTACALSATRGSLLLVALVWLLALGEELAAFALFGTGHAIPAPAQRRLAAWRTKSTRWLPHGQAHCAVLGKAPASLQEGVEHRSSLSSAGRLSEDLVQRLERVQSQGLDRLSGTFAAQFVCGQATAHVHIAFCPPFAKVPRLDYRQADGPAARIKIGQVLPHGARFDIKLATPTAEPTRVELEVRATSEVDDECGTTARSSVAGDTP